MAFGEHTYYHCDNCKQILKSTDEQIYIYSQGLLFCDMACLQKYYHIKYVPAKYLFAYMDEKDTK